MAELATIARPYAEALFKADGIAEPAVLADELQSLADVAGQAQLRQFADNPKVSDTQVLEVIGAVVKTPVSTAVANLLRTMIENGRLAALPEVAAQFHALVNQSAGVSDAVIHSAVSIGEEKDSISTVRPVDGTSWEYERPAGVVIALQVSEHSVEP